MLWNNHHVCIRVKCHVYRATVLAALLLLINGLLYSVQTDRLQAYMMSHLKSIMGIYWRKKIRNGEALKRAGLPFLIFILIQMNLRWLGHLEKIDHKHLPRQILYSQLMEENQNQARPKLWFKDTVKKDMNMMDIDKSACQEKAKNKDGWMSLIRHKTRALQEIS